MPLPSTPDFIPSGRPRSPSPPFFLLLLEPSRASSGAAACAPNIPGRTSFDPSCPGPPLLLPNLHRTSTSQAELLPSRIGPRSDQSPWKPCSKLRPSWIRSLRSSSTRIEAAVSSAVSPSFSLAPSPTYIGRPLAGTSSPSLLLRHRPPTNHLRSRFLHQTSPR